MRQSPKEALIDFNVPWTAPMLKASMFLAKPDPSRHSQLLRDLEDEAAKSADGKCASYLTTLEAAYTLASVFRVSANTARAFATPTEYKPQEPASFKGTCSNCAGVGHKRMQFPSSKRTDRPEAADKVAFVARRRMQLSSWPRRAETPSS
jgi:hypothetical protein